MEHAELKFIDSVLEKYDSDKSKIIAIMQDVQEKYRYLPQEALEYIAGKVGMSESTILQALYDATGTDEHKPTSDDGLFTLEIVSCLGACGLSPVVMVNDTVHAAMTPEKARALVNQLREEA